MVDLVSKVCSRRDVCKFVQQHGVKFVLGQEREQRHAELYRIFCTFLTYARITADSAENAYFFAAADFFGCANCKRIQLGVLIRRQLGEMRVRKFVPFYRNYSGKG